MNCGVEMANMNHQGICVQYLVYNESLVLQSITNGHIM